MARQPKSRRQSFVAQLESMERRELLTGATVQMTPGSLSQTTLPYSLSTLAIIKSTVLSIARDINNNNIDFNSDGLPDLVNVSESWALNGGANALSAGFMTAPLLADGSGRFVLTNSNGQPYAPDGGAAAVLDWNGDGKQDYISLSSFGSGSTQKWLSNVYENNGKGVFTTAVSSEIVQNGNDGTSELGQILCMADFNSDGAPDIVASGDQNFYLYNGVLVNGKWNGTFDSASQQLLKYQDNSTNYINPQAADLNNDGKPDIAGSSGLYKVSQPDQVSIYLNNSNGATTSFDAAYGVGALNISFGQLVIGDMNLDGNMDIVAGNTKSYNETYYILTNDGTGHFKTGEFKAYNKEQTVSGGLGVGDWNFDGQPDVTIGTAWVADPPIPESNSAVAGGVGLAFNTTYQPLGLKSSTFPTAKVGVPYSYQIQFSGGNSSLPYNVSLSTLGNPLPAGLTLSVTGLISGTPTQSGSFQPVFDITQPDGQYGSALGYLPVNSLPEVIIQPGALPNAVSGIAYQQPLTTNIGPALWAVSQGALPAGMTLSQNGVISGTPTVLGQYNFQVTATGAGYQTSLNYVLNVQSAAAPIVTSLVRYGYHAQPTTLVASFSQAMDATSAANASNYLLVMAGHDGKFGTSDDRPVAISRVSYDSASQTATIEPVQRSLPLHQKYRLTIIGTPTAGVRNAAGTFLGGQGVGAPGTNYVTTFDSSSLAGPAPTPIRNRPIRIRRK